MTEGNAQFLPATQYFSVLRFQTCSEELSEMSLLHSKYKISHIGVYQLF